VDGGQFSVANGGRTTVLTASGELDLGVRDDLREVLAGLAGHVTVDLTEVTFVDSSAIGVFVGAHKRLSGAGGDLRFRNPQDMPRRALEIVGLAAWIDD
jgi:anti-anti-sigma factor